MINNDKAVEALTALVQVPGALRIITSEHACGGSHDTGKFKGDRPVVDNPTTPEEKEACDAFEFNMKHPNHFVIKDVVRLVGPNDRGTLRAYTADDVDYCEGRPPAVLKRLQEWQTV
jgi:hypothetical protein